VEDHPRVWLFGALLSLPLVGLALLLAAPSIGVMWEPFGDLALKGRLAPVPTLEVRVDPTASA
jgi:hypothetical protein